MSPSESTPSPQSAVAANAGSQNGDALQPSGPVSLDSLAQALDALNPPTAPEASDSRPAAVAAPEMPPAPAAAADAGNELPPEEQPHEGADAPAAGEDLSQLEEFNALDPEVQKHALELAKELKAQGLSVGEAKRIGKLLHNKSESEARLTQQIETLQQQIEELKAGPPATADAAQTLPMPAKVAELKNNAEIERREMQLQNVLDWCEDNPEGGEANGQVFTPEEVKAIRRDSRQELRWLPKRREQLNQQAAVQQAQRQAREQTLKDFPALNDPANPDAKLAQQLIQSEPALAHRPNRDYLALALATGHRLLQSELAARKAPKPAANGNGAVARKPQASSGGAAAPRATGGQAQVAQLLKTAKERPSPAALEALLPHVQ